MKALVSSLVLSLFFSFSSLAVDSDNYLVTCVAMGNSLNAKASYLKNSSGAVHSDLQKIKNINKNTSKKDAILSFMIFNGRVEKIKLISNVMTVDLDIYKSNCDLGGNNETTILKLENLVEKYLAEMESTDAELIKLIERFVAEQ
jgi:hypothetical protein